MKLKHVALVTLMILTVGLLLTACGKGGQGTEAQPTTAEVQETTEAGQSESGGEVEETEEPAESPEAPAEAEGGFPETLVVHPDATDIEANPASGTYIYVVPMMVQETTEYLLTELQARGWEPLGQPTIMGHLATLNMKMGDSRLSVSMQDNERSQTTRVQMLLMEQ